MFKGGDDDLAALWRRSTERLRLMVTSCIQEGLSMFLLAWPLIGALIGVSAAQRRGFSVVGGVIGGLLLGPLAFLMYFVSGVSRGDEQVKCPHCAEWIKPEAKVCKHCHRDVIQSVAV
jgi:hypothetical protein